MNYKKIGDFIQQVNLKNEDGEVKNLLGVNLDKVFMPSVANLNGVDMTKYKIIKKGQFGCKLMSVGRDKKLPISHLKDCDKAIISSAYYVFEVKNEKELLPEYLMMWFLRSESDRFLWFLSGGDVRGRITWDDLCTLPIRIPSIEKQQQIVDEYNTVSNRIQLNEKININLEAMAQALYKHWFVDFEFPVYKKDGTLSSVERYKSSGGKMVYNEELDKDIPVGWSVETVKDFSKEMKSGGTPSRANIEFWNKKDIPWLKTGELKNKVIIEAEEYITEKALKNSSAKLLPINSVLIAMYGQGNTKGQIGYLKIKSTTNQACCSIICENEFNSTFLYYHLRVNRDNIVKDAIGGAQPNLSKELIENIYIIKPTSEILKKTPFVAIMNNKWKSTCKNKTLQELQSLLLAKMTKVETKPL
ncbi:restriction endonuclease subunit S [Polaribacter sp. Asnod1-A03]|uniref:restriction endonuclease subunit S n=1 Tax=Polaribacter sp. Asnod1-A03 TaxID=3160581 RepID=UPI003868E69F